MNGTRTALRNHSTQGFPLRANILDGPSLQSTRHCTLAVEEDYSDEEINAFITWCAMQG